MGAYSYLVNEDRREVVFLGKGDWNRLFPTYSQLKKGYAKFKFSESSYELVKSRLGDIVYGWMHLPNRNDSMRIYRLYKKLLKFTGNSSVYCVCDYVEEDKYNEITSKIIGACTDLDYRVKNDFYFEVKI